MKRFLSVYIISMLILFVCYYWNPVFSFLENHVTVILAQVSAWCIMPFDSHVYAEHISIMTERPNDLGFKGVSIVAGCNGIEACIILISGIIAFPARWKERLTGIVVGILGVQALNVLRVICLFYLGQWSKTAFDWAHLYIWPILIILDALVIFLLWIRWVNGRQRPQTPHTPTPPQTLTKAEVHG